MLYILRCPSIQGLKIRELLAEDFLARALTIICRYGIVDSRLLSSLTDIEESVAETIIGALLNAGYLIEERLSGACMLCPLSSYCAGYGRGVKVFRASEKLRRICESIDHQHLKGLFCF